MISIEPKTLKPDEIIPKIDPGIEVAALVVAYAEIKIKDFCEFIEVFESGQVHRKSKVDLKLRIP